MQVYQGSLIAFGNHQCTMEASVYILQFLAILVSARLLGEIAAALGAPSVIGELLAGILIGPSLLGWVEVNDVILILAEIGVILLLFEVGLDSDFNKLLRTGTQSVVVALGGFVAPMLAGFAVAHYLFDLDVMTSLFIGGTLTATSIGITVRTLADLKRQNSQVSGGFQLPCCWLPLSPSLPVQY